MKTFMEVRSCAWNYLIVDTIVSTKFWSNSVLNNSMTFVELDIIFLWQMKGNAVFKSMKNI